MKDRNTFKLAFFDQKHTACDKTEIINPMSEIIKKRSPVQPNKSRGGHLQVQRSLGITTKGNQSISIPHCTNNTVFSTKQNISDIVERVKVSLLPQTFNSQTFMRKAAINKTRSYNSSVIEK